MAPVAPVAADERDPVVVEGHVDFCPVVTQRDGVRVPGSETLRSRAQLMNTPMCGGAKWGPTGRREHEPAPTMALLAAGNTLAAADKVAARCSASSAGTRGSGQTETSYGLIMVQR